MAKRLRIGLFLDAFFPVIDGVCEVVDHYARELAPYADVFVFVPSYPGKPYDDSVFPYPVIRCGSLPVPMIDYNLPTPDLDPLFLRKVNESDLDLVHIHSPFSIGKLGIRYAKKHGIPVIATLHSQFRRDFMRAVKNETIAQNMTTQLMKTFAACDETWTVNDAMEKLLHADYGYRGISRVVRNATEMEPVADKEAACRMINERFSIRRRDKVFLFVGRLNMLKNVFLIARSLVYLKERADFPFKMLFLGNGQDEKKLKALIKENGVEELTIFGGRVADRDVLAAAYARADLFLFPSLYDASSLVQVEAASQGTPGVFVEGSATSDTITDDVNGFLSYNDAELFAVKVLSVMHDPKKRKKIGENARRDLYLKWEDVVQEVYRNYLQILNEDTG